MRARIIPTRRCCGFAESKHVIRVLHWQAIADYLVHTRAAFSALSDPCGSGLILGCHRLPLVVPSKKGKEWWVGAVFEDLQCTCLVEVSRGTLRHPSVISICLLGYHGGVRPTCSSWLLSARVTVSGA